MIKRTLIFSILLASIVLTSCSRDDDYGFSMVNNVDTRVSDADGSVAVTAKKSISASDFIRCVSGNGWREAETHEVYDDGTLQEEDYWRRMVGGGPDEYVFGDNTVTRFAYIDAIPCLAYFKQTFTYDENTNQVSFNGDYYFTVLSINESGTEVRIIKKGGVRDDKAGGLKQVYLYVVLKRLSDSEVEALWENYWVNGNDLRREMTREDLMHKWVLTSYSDNLHIWHKVTTDRKDDRYYLRFHSDGTFEGMADGKSISGTFEYSDEGFIKLIPADDAPTNGNYYLQYIWQVKFAHIRSAAYLYLNVENEQSFRFVRSPED